MRYLFRTVWNKSGLGMRAEEETKSVEKRGKFGLLHLKEGAEGGQPALVVGSEDANYFTRESRFPKDTEQWRVRGGVEQQTTWL